MTQKTSIIEQAGTLSTARPVRSIGYNGNRKTKEIAFRISMRDMDPHLVCIKFPESHEAEQYYTLRHAIENQNREGSGVVVAICSALPGDGKSTTAINLSCALAKDYNVRTLLIEADLRRSGDLLRKLGIKKNPMLIRGMVDAVLDYNMDLDDVIQKISQLNLSILPAGKTTSSPYEILNSKRFNELLAQARHQFDYVILDVPPIIPVPDYKILTKWINKFVMVIRAEITPTDAITDAISLLGRKKLLGIVFNGYRGNANMKYFSKGYGSKNNLPRRTGLWSKLVSN